MGSDTITRKVIVSDPITAHYVCPTRFPSARHNSATTAKGTGMEQTDTMQGTDWAALASELEQLLKLRSFPIGMKLFETVEAMEAVPKIRRPEAIHTTDQIVAQAARLGRTVGITGDDLVGAQCR